MNKKNLYILFLMCFTTLSAQEKSVSFGALVTDRPDATESPSVVPKGFLQVETGAFYTELKDEEINEKTTVYNTTLMRFGLLNNLELRLGWDISEIRNEVEGNVFEDPLKGMSPLLFGVKVAIAEENGPFPEIGLIGHLQLPFSASNDFKRETTGVDFRFAFGHTLSEKSSLSYNLGAAWGGDSSEAVYEYTLAYGYSITDALGMYVELYGGLPENSKAEHLWDAGLTYLIGNNLQFDVSAGTGLNKTQDIFLSAGVSFRIPR